MFHKIIYLDLWENAVQGNHFFNILSLVSVCYTFRMHFLGGEIKLTLHENINILLAF